MRPLAALLLPALLAAHAAAALEIGINTHHPAPLNAQVAAVMHDRNFRSVRVNLRWDQDPAALLDLAGRVRANGGNVQAVLLVAHQWDHGCSRDLARVEELAHAQALHAASLVQHVVHDFELLNESQLRSDVTAEVPWNSARGSAAAYEGQPCTAAVASALRGMSRAIAELRTRSGLPLRVIVGAAGRDFGFLSFLRSRGVQWDVTGFHVYPHLGSPSLLSDPWYGTGGPLVQLAAFGKPIHINEFNCGEIYDAAYENAAQARHTETCLRGLARHLRELHAQQIAPVEALHLYELLDEPHKPVPENRFGLMVDLAQPKPHLLLATAFAGGRLSPAERDEITRRSLLDAAAIDALRARQGATSR